MALILTKAGAEAYAVAEATGIKLQGTHMAVGDGNGVAVSPTNVWEALTNETWRGDLQSITANEAGEAVFVAHVPITVGGWYIREVGIFAGETLIAVAAHPETWKPAPEAADKVELVITAPLAFSDTENISFTVDTTKVLASQEHVAEAIDTHDTDPEAHADIRQAIEDATPDASTIVKGIVMLGTKDEANARTVADKVLTPESIADYFNVNDIATSYQAQNGTGGNRVMTPELTALAIAAIALLPAGDGSELTDVNAQFLRGLSPDALTFSPWLTNRTATGTWTLTVIPSKPVFLVAHAPLDQSTNAYIEYKVLSGTLSASNATLNRVSGLGLAAAGAGYSNCAIVVPNSTTLEIDITARVGGAVVTAFQNNA
ncbi:MAG: phage tail protein [Pseudodesulfovibrio sp.]|uniref:phage tail-collar fiber domain-containing protein n=1 Tax=Pseudodesulfovibrio sp. TaxID=2035812 RepID=UPI003D13725F